MIRRNVLRAGALLLLSSATVAEAGGYEIPENTTRGLGRGGANIAHVADPTATYFNPAGLTRVDGFGFSGSLNLPMQFTRFHRSDFEYQALGSEDTLTVQYKEERNQISWLPAPMLFFSHDFGLKNTAFGFAVYGPSATPAMRWGGPDENAETPNFANPKPDPRGGGNVYMLQDADLLVVYPSISVAHRFENINLSIGGALQMVYASTRVNVGLEGTTGTAYLNEADVRSPENPNGVLFAEEPGSMVGAEVKTSGVGITGNFGIMYDPIPQLSIGLSYRPAHKVKMKGTFAIVEDAALGGLNLELLDDKASMDITMPHVLRAGINYRHIVDGFEVFDIELAATYEMWSIVNEMVAHTPGPITSSAFASRPIEDVAIPFNFKNTVSLRLGGDFNGMLDRETGQGLVLRGGFFWESNGAPSQYSNILFMPFQRIALSGGLSYHFEKVSIDLGMMWMRNFTREVTDGEYNIINPLWVCLNGEGVNGGTKDEVLARCEENGDRSPYHAVNNGTYKTDMVNISAGLTYNW